MSLTAGVIVLVLLLLGPVAIRAIERNLEAYILAIGIAATLLGGSFERQLAIRALGEPVPITVAVFVAGVAFSFARPALDRAFERLRRRFSRRALIGVSVLVIAALSGVITAVVGALVLVEIVGMLRLARRTRVNVTVAGCFAIGLGAVLTPLGYPLSTLATSELGLPFFGLFYLLWPYVVPGVIASSILAAIIAGGDYEHLRAAPHVRETIGAAAIQSLRIFGFVSGLVLVSHAYAPLAERYVSLMSDEVLYWANSVSAILDNATLVALEMHDIDRARAKIALIALLISGGMLIPGNVPNIVSAGVLKIGSAEWARIGIPIGFVMLGIYFAVLKLVT